MKRTSATMLKCGRPSVLLRLAPMTALLHSSEHQRHLRSLSLALSGRVRVVAVRLRPGNAEESATETDFADCVELHSELKRLKLHKNNWDTDNYEFDDVLTEYASQKRVYEVVAKCIEGVTKLYSHMDGYLRDIFLVPRSVRVAVKLRPRNTEESTVEADFADCVELQPEVS
ncbi:hypothetical protein ACLB2K_031530 [Fragaria x ananassa]